MFGKQAKNLYEMQNNMGKVNLADFVLLFI